METNKVYLGNCLDVIKTFPDESVDCVVTSPPYYGLRDYGTGRWEGGDPACDHKEAKIKTRFDYDLSDLQKNSKGTDVPMYMHVCPKCGAVRCDEQIGLEESPDEYIDRLVSLFREIRRVLKKDGTCWVNLGDSYSGNCSRTSKGRAGMGAEREGVFTKGGGLPSKNLIGIPWRFAFAMQADGWILRQDIIWAKPNPMPESVTDRCTKSHEYIFLFAKNEKYYFDNESIQEESVSQSASSARFGWKKYGDNEDPHFRIYSGNEWNPSTKKVEDKEYVVRNKRDVWFVNVHPTKEAHFATYPPMLIQPCILAGCRRGGVVLDPFMGSGTTGIVARKLGRKYVGIELNPEYHKMAERRIAELGEDLFSDI